MFILKSGTRGLIIVIGNILGSVVLPGGPIRLLFNNDTQESVCFDCK